jgi:transcription-repair coupling factor (superfamily II helicase)
MQSQAPFFHYLQKNNPIDLLICEDDRSALVLADVAKYFQKDVVVFPDFRASYGDDLRAYQEELHQLFSALQKFYTKKDPLAIVPLRSLLFPLPKKELFDSFSISFGDTLSLETLKNRLIEWGYNFVDIVELSGEVSFRGDIIDIFPPACEHPYRISLFDTEVEQIKAFALDSQRSIGEEVETIEITPAFLALTPQMYSELEQKVLQSEFDALQKDIASLGFWYLDDLAEDFLHDKKAVFSQDLSHILQEAYAIQKPLLSKERFAFEILAEDDGYRDIVISDAKQLLQVHSDKKQIVIAQNKAILKQYDLFGLDSITFVEAPYIVNVLTPSEIVISLNKAQKKRRNRKTSIMLDDLKKGDYVVHEDYGVGIFDGIEQAEILGGVKDFVVIRYMGDDKVMLPVENLASIDRYIAAGGSVPTLDRLGKGSFARLKESVKKKLFEIASKIVNIAATRALIEAPKIKVNHHEIEAFQKTAGFTYTPDQAQAIEEILEDLKSGKIMDRLLSGDVGFGKTEVAMNAIYATKLAGYQSALIVPTTLLSAQHFKTLQERLEKEGVRIAKLDRFVSTKEKNAVKKALLEGEIDCVVGTHALFGLEFKNLALVIVDEEHKFGVKQKEKIKELYHNVHMLSMSATPIPRSLNQALSQIKTMSTLLTPPSQRLDVRTFVKEWDEKLVKEIIMREVRRGGQVFYVHNSIEHMPIKLGELKAILPDLRIVMLHSKISAAQTEKELLRFEAGEYDLMLATSIVESGIHMPRVNTIIVDGADRFGIADLHQLRGRVGRSNLEGFAYFLVDDKQNLTDEAKKRLLALETNSFLGSGSVLAHHDLEIRGGGNLIGDAQSGHIKNIGYSLYLRMLEDAICELANNVKEKEHKIDIKLTISAYISSEIVQEDRLRIDLYRRLSQAKDTIEIYEIEEEMIDRFGELDTPTKQYIELIVIKLLATQKKIKSIMNYAQNITILFSDDSKEMIQAKSKDDDDIIAAVLQYLRK